MSATQPWRPRLSWGVSLENQGPARMMLGDAWDHATWDAYRRIGWRPQVSRPLLFSSRAAARAWCKAKTAEWKDAGWIFRPVRVRETWEIVR